MDNISEISADGLEILANPSNFINDGEVIRYEKEVKKMEDYKRNKQLRKQVVHQKKIERVEYASSLLGETNSIASSEAMSFASSKRTLQKGNSIGPYKSINNQDVVSIYSISSKKSKNIMPKPESFSGSYSESSKHIICERKQPLENALPSPSIYSVHTGYDSDEENKYECERAPIEEIKIPILPKEKLPIDNEFGASQVPENGNTTTVPSNSQMDKLVELAVIKALKKHSFKTDTESLHYDNYLEDDVNYRLKNMKEQGVEYSDDFDLNTANKRRKELEHWRMKLTLEEQELEQNCSTFIAVGADLLEGLCDAVDFKAFETRSLSGEMDKAIRDGRFSSCVKHYTNMGGGKFMKNPLLNFLTTFSSIALKNHLNQKKNKILSHDAGNKRIHKRTDPIAPAPAYFRPPNQNSFNYNGSYYQSPYMYHNNYPPPNNWNPNPQEPVRDKTQHNIDKKPVKIEKFQEQQTISSKKQQKDIGKTNDSEIIKENEDTRNRVCLDPVTGTQRPLMTELSSTLPLDSISSTLSKFKPALNHVKRNMENQIKLDEQKKKIDNHALDTIKPISLFA